MLNLLWIGLGTPIVLTVMAFAAFDYLVDGLRS